jgi:DNA-directed RNA polymerase subunit RPC12/RpoP
MLSDNKISASIPVDLDNIQISDAVLCPKCGTSNTAGSIFCSKCGHSFTSEGNI